LRDLLENHINIFGACYIGKQSLGFLVILLFFRGVSIAHPLVVHLHEKGVDLIEIFERDLVNFCSIFHFLKECGIA